MFNVLECETACESHHPPGKSIYEAQVQHKFISTNPIEPKCVFDCFYECFWLFSGCPHSPLQIMVLCLLSTVSPLSVFPLSLSLSLSLPLMMVKISADSRNTGTLSHSLSLSLTPMWSLRQASLCTISSPLPAAANESLCGSSEWERVSGLF